MFWNMRKLEESDELRNQQMLIIVSKVFDIISRYKAVACTPIHAFSEFPLLET